MLNIIILSEILSVSKCTVITNHSFETSNYELKLVLTMISRRLHLIPHCARLLSLQLKELNWYLICDNSARNVSNACSHPFTPPPINHPFLICCRGHCNQGNEHSRWDLHTKPHCKSNRALFPIFEPTSEVF